MGAVCGKAGQKTAPVEDARPDKHDLSRVFRQFDTDGSGDLDKEELQAALKGTTNLFF